MNKRTSRLSQFVETLILFLGVLWLYFSYEGPEIWKLDFANYYQESRYSDLFGVCALLLHADFSSFFLLLAVYSCLWTSIVGDALPSAEGWQCGSLPNFPNSHYFRVIYCRHRICRPSDLRLFWWRLVGMCLLFNCRVYDDLWHHNVFAVGCAIFLGSFICE